MPFDDMTIDRVTHITIYTSHFRGEYIEIYYIWTAERFCFWTDFEIIFFC